MPKKIERRTWRRPCVGDLRDRITIQNRNVVPPNVNEFDLDLNFSTHAEVWASIETPSGETLFDSVAGNDEIVTHRVMIRYLEGVTSESWILLDDGTRLDVLATENLEERNEFISLTCQRTGPATAKASGA